MNNIDVADKKKKNESLTGSGSGWFSLIFSHLFKIPSFLLLSRIAAACVSGETGWHTGRGDWKRLSASDQVSLMGVGQRSRLSDKHLKRPTDSKGKKQREME